MCISLTQHDTAWAVTIPIRLQNLDGGQTTRHRVSATIANIANAGVATPADEIRLGEDLEEFANLSFKLVVLV